jgi:hypothetical protein
VLASDLVVLAIDSDHAIARSGNLLVVLWIRETRPDAVQRVAGLVRSTHEERSEQLGLLQVALPGAANPEQPAREALIQLVRSSKGALAASAVVYPGEGFIMAAARAFVSGIAMLARPGFPHLVFPTRVEASDWLARLLPKQAGRYWTAREVAAVIDELVGRVAVNDPHVASLPRT